MSKIEDGAKKIAGAAGTVGALAAVVDFKNVLRGKGTPREGHLKIAKIPVFEVNEQGQRWFLGIRLRDLKVRK